MTRKRADLEGVGNLTDGRAVHRVVLTSGGARAEVLDLGAAIESWQPAGLGRSVVIGFGGDVQERWRRHDVYAGVVGGRYLSRIRDGRFELDGRVIELPTNDRGHTLHGGPDGFDRRTWRIEDRTVDAVTLTLVSPDGDQGFPGELTVVATWTLSEATLDLTVSATTGAPTVVNVGAHPYLDAGPDATLTVRADRWIPVDQDDVALPGSAPVDGTGRDARSPIPVDAGTGFDFSYLPEGEGFRHVAVLAGDDVSIALSTDQPALQVFTEGALGGIALEAQQLPDGPNRRGSDGIGAHVVLRPGETFRSHTTWRATPGRT